LVVEIGQYIFFLSSCFVDILLSAQPPFPFLLLYGPGYLTLAAENEDFSATTESLTYQSKIRLHARSVSTKEKFNVHELCFV
jgi:hypothetical protein